MINRGITYPLIPTTSIAITYFRFPSCFVRSLLFLSEVVITLEVEITPI
jgi:hypothetical protein